MNTKPGKISISDLHKIISLSEKLLLENSISEICDLVISLVKDEFNCLAEIELHDQDITNIDKYNILEDDYSGIDTGDYEVSLEQR